MENSGEKEWYPLPDYIVADVQNLQAIEETPLRKKASPLQFPLSDEDKDDVNKLLVKFQMERDMVGLAAPQIGISKRAIIFQVPNKKLLPHNLWINPTYEKKGDQMKSDYEECFSVKGYTGPVNRYKRVRYKAYDVEGNVIEGVAKNYTARVIQHEIDHLNGILFIDLVPKGKLITLHKYIEGVNDYMNDYSDWK